MRTRFASLPCALAGLLLAGAAFAQTPASAPDDTNPRAYQPATLAQLFAAKPSDPKAAMELAPLGQWFRVEAIPTGNRRKPSVAARPLVRAWVESRGFKSDLAEALFKDDFPDVEFEEAGTKYWILFGYPAALGLERTIPKEKMVLLVQRIGFVGGQPFNLVALFGTPEQFAAALAKPPPPPPPLEPVRTRVAKYGHGEARVTIQGKDLTFPIDARDLPSSPHGLFATSGSPGKMLSINFCTNATNCAMVTVFGIDDSRAPPVMAFWLMRDGLPVDLHPIDECRLTLKTATAQAVSGVYDCSLMKGKSPLGKVVFSARP